MISALKYAQFFLIAAITSALTRENMPETNWEWWQFLGGSLLAGIIATKALQSNPTPK